VKVVVDHVRGSRRGQRQEFIGAERIAIGRHPRSDVGFDAHRDIDASSRHAELRRQGDGYVLCDIGSSNGTFVAHRRIGEIPLTTEVPVEIEFGAGGPVLRVWIGADDARPEPPGKQRRVPVALIALLAVAALGLLAWILLR
jgi:hypothetical protein